MVAFLILASVPAEAEGEDEGGNVASVTAGGAETEYAAFSDAVNALSGGGTLKLLADISDACVIIVDSDVTIDLNGHTMTSGDLGSTKSSFITVNEGATLEITDTSENGSGTIEMYTTANICYVLSVNGTAIMKAGTIQEAEGSSSGYLVYVDSGTFTMGGGKIGAGEAELSKYLVYVKDGKFEMNGGEIEVTGVSYGIYLSNGTVEINPAQDSDVKFTAVDTAYIIYGKGTVTIKGGTFSNSGTKYMLSSSGGAVTISGGVFTNGSTAEMLYCSSGTITITGGTFDGGEADILGESSKYSVSGGNFSQPVPAIDCADGYGPVSGDDGYYTVAELTADTAPVILSTATGETIDNPYFAEPYRALAAAGGDGYTVTVVKDTETTDLSPAAKAQLIVQSGVTLTCNSVTVSVDGAEGTSVLNYGTIEVTKYVMGSSGNAILQNEGTIICGYMNAKTVDSDGNGWINRGAIILTSTTASTLTHFVNTGTITGGSDGVKMTISGPVSIDGYTYSDGTYSWNGDAWIGDGTILLIHTEGDSVVLSYHEEMSTAVSAASDGDTIRLLGNYEKIMEVDKQLILDLNGYSITYGNQTSQYGVITIAGGGDLTVIDSTVGSQPAVSGGVVTYEAGSIVATYGLPTVYVKAGGTFTLEAGIIMATGTDNAAVYIGNAAVGDDAAGATGAIVNITGGYVCSENAYGVIILGDGTESDVPQLSVTGGVVQGYSAGIMGQGVYHYTDISISGGTVTASDGPGIYHPQKGTLTITGGTITGLVGVAVKGGTVTIEGGYISGTGEAYVPESGGSSGINLTGSALYVEDNYGFDVTVTITGGYFVTGDEEAVAVLMLFSTEGSTSSISVSGGYFTSRLSDEYCADGYQSPDVTVKVGGVRYYTVCTHGGNAATVTAKEDVVDATCATEGHYDSVTRCAVCGEELSRETIAIPATGEHDWDDGVVIIQPTQTSAGKMMYTCKVCGEVRYEDIPPEPMHSEIDADVEISVDVDMEQLYTDEDRAIIEAGGSVDYSVSVSTPTVSKETEDLMDAAVSDLGEVLDAYWMDINLSRDVVVDGKQQSGLVSNAATSVSFTVGIPDSLLSSAAGHNGSYCVVGIHDGEAMVLDSEITTVDGQKCITFATDKFSYYALVFVGEAENGSESGSESGSSDNEIDEEIVLAVAACAVAMATVLAALTLRRD